MTYPKRPTVTPAAPGEYRRLGFRPIVGHLHTRAYTRETGIADRRGVTHAVNWDGRTYRALCGVTVSGYHGDEPSPITMPKATDGSDVGCKRCRKVIEGAK
jgi:hypothetical protein